MCLAQLPDEKLSDLEERLEHVATKFPLAFILDLLGVATSLNQKTDSCPRPSLPLFLLGCQNIIAVLLQVQDALRHLLRLLRLLGQQRNPLLQNLVLLLQALNFLHLLRLLLRQLVKPLQQGLRDLLLAASPSRALP